MKIRKIISGTISYILALILAVIFALFLSASVGWFMFVALILALVLSVFFALLTKRFVSIDCFMETELLSKGDSYEVMVVCENKSIFPTTPIEIIMENGNGLKTKDKNILVSVMPRAKKKVNVQYEAKISGPSEVGIEKVLVTDYLGIFRFEIKKKADEIRKKKICVIPNMSDISAKDDRILMVMQAANNGDDSEDTAQSAVNTFGGFPGYDNREYVVGDPLKRINWKQSAKRDKILVRLDDEIAARCVNIVIDSVYKTALVKQEAMAGFGVYEYIAVDEIIPTIGEMAVENALGIARVLIISSYTVNLFVNRSAGFTRYVLEDEKDLENIRIELADYEFDKEMMADRFPNPQEASNNSVFIFSTPNPYEEAYSAIESAGEIISTSIFSVIEESKSGKNETVSMYFGKKAEYKKSVLSKMKDGVKGLLMPFLLALVLSVTVFAAYRIPVLSYWTLLQATMCFVAFVLCMYTYKHRIKGSLLLVVFIFGILSVVMELVFSTGYGMPYMQWFMSGGDVIDTTNEYLSALLLIFTTFFSLLVFYYTQARYRTSAVMLLSIIPFVVYGKIVREVQIGYVMTIIVLNVAVFLINSRKVKDKGKRIVGYITGIVSVAMYALFFVLIALAVPKDKETKYYYMFEEAFLGGNTSTILPIQYTGNSDYSGNADNYNQLNNRKLYSISVTGLDEPLYLKRQVYDIYDYNINRWFGSPDYNEYKDENEIEVDKDLLNVRMFVNAINKAEELSPGFIDKYGLNELADYVFIENEETLFIETRNFSSSFYIVPGRTTNLDTTFGQTFEKYVNENGAWITGKEKLPRNMEYQVSFYQQYKNYDKWIELKGSDYSLDESIEMLYEMQEILEDEGTSLYVVNAYLAESLSAKAYNESCKELNKDIPKKVKELAFELTKDCEYEYEKATVLAEYFAGTEFLYDLSYDAPDDSVEYFLFEGKTGTCSDFATAYVLMARSVGLTVRYVEGFVPSEEQSLEYDREYVVRTRSAHAYPEVFIPNYGYIVFEPTIAAVADSSDLPQGGMAGYMLTLGYRVLLIFAVFSLAIILLLLIIKVVAPTLEEKWFIYTVNKAKPNRAVVMIYSRINKKYTNYTPKQYALQFKDDFQYNISSLTSMVEKAAYTKNNITIEEKNSAKQIYEKVKKIIKKNKKV